jgi:hypothetical protein
LLEVIVILFILKKKNYGLQTFKMQIQSLLPLPDHCFDRKLCCLHWNFEQNLTIFYPSLAIQIGGIGFELSVESF